MNKKLVFSIAPALAVLGLLVSFFGGSNTEISETQNKTAKKIDRQAEEASDALAQVDSEAHNYHDHSRNDKVNQADDERDDNTTKSYPKNFNFQNEAVKLSKLQKEYPGSKRALLDIALAKNPFGTAKAHSAAELAQRQQGALKVEALKIIFNLEKDKSQLEKDLSDIAREAQDPVVAKIAAAALESLKNGRSFFDDTTGAIENLPIPD